ncbi:SulP family inorganic anion transporter [Nocardioidaceae bacterium SCSIO 66511]|nr:SulP family inorganic anion transporter [Nocardioidaceae bacterium SCSIO 66511]
MASSVLAGVNPVHGLYACFAGPVAGGLTSSTRLMVITTTSAAALAAGSALESVDADQRSDALLILTLLAGAFMVLAGALRLGRYVRFVSHSVMVGFLTGIAMNIVLAQFANLVGADPSGDIALAQAADVVLHPRMIDLPSTAAGLAALAFLVVLGRGRLAVVSSIFALLVPTTIVVLTNADGVARVEDVGDIPSGLPMPGLPDVDAFSPGLVTGALAVAAIVLVQGVGVAEATPNSDGSRTNPDQDFSAQGAGNLAAGIFSGQPVGGSVGQTALNLAAGGRTRWSVVISGIWMLAILGALSTVVGLVAMPTLAAVLIFAAVKSFAPTDVRAVIRAGNTPQIALMTTFVATITLPVAAAVGIGVALSLLLQINQERVDLRVVRLVPGDQGRLTETESPNALLDIEVVVLDVYGSLFYAGARTLQLQLPDPSGSTRPAVILRLRGRSTLGATFFKVIGDYAKRLKDVDGRLYLSGLDESLASRWERDRLPERSAPIRLYRATPTIGESTHAAFLDARARIVDHLD